MSEMANRVRAARAYKGLTQKQLAEAAGVDVQVVKRMESGTRDPKRPELWAIAEVCGLPREFFTVDFSELDMLATAHDREMLAAEMARRPAGGGDGDGQSLMERIDGRLQRIEEIQARLLGNQEKIIGDHDLLEQINVAVEEIRRAPGVAARKAS